MTKRFGDAAEGTDKQPDTPNDLRFADYLQDVVACFDPQLRHTYVNSAVELFTGRPRSDFIGKTNRELGMPAEQVDRWDTTLGEVFRTGQAAQIGFPFDTPDGERLFLSQLLPQTDARGIVTSVMTIARDMGSGQLANLMAEHFRAIIESSDDAIVGKTLDGIVTSWNRGAEEIFGYSRQEMIGNSLLVLFPDSRKDEERFIVERLLLGEKVDHFETVRIRKDGQPVHVSVSISPIRNKEGVIIGASKIARDITPLKREQERLQLALDAGCNGLWDWDLRTGRVYRSPQYYRLTGHDATEDTHDLAFFHRSVDPQDEARVKRVIAEYLAGNVDRLEFEFRLSSNRGQSGLWGMVRGRAVERDAQGLPMRIVGTLSDITQSKRAELALREREQRLSRVLEGSDQGYWDWNIQTNDLIVSPRWESMLGYGPGELDVSGGRWDEVVHPDDLAATMEQVRRHLQGETPLFEIELRCRTKSGAWLWVVSRGKVVERDTEGKPLMVSGTHTDISHLKAHEQELDRIAHYDPLTGAPNRRLLADRLAQAIARANRNGLSLAVCYLDLDGFKAINDRYGHSAGDKLLVEVTEQLKHVLRGEDTLARLGGDEFVLLLADIGSPQECSLILQRVLHSVSGPMAIDGNTITVTASIGVSLYPQDHSDGDTLLRHADQAMYAAKDAGKNRFNLFDLASDRKVHEHRQYLDRLAVALEQEEFLLHYQPQVDLQTGQIVGVEALIRWQHPELGLRSPAEFLPYIEGSALECRVGQWVLHRALRQAEQWKAQGCAVNVSVNISARHLLSAGFEEELRMALNLHTGVSSDSLELEVLESSAIDDIVIAASVLNQCRSMGVRLALDDFGTGYSSLTYLRKLPFDLLKIDQSFVRDMLNDPEDRGIVESVIRMASAFNRSVIAEGVETLKHGAALLELGCKLAQGYGIARPMPPEQFAEWSARWRSEQAWRSLQDWPTD